MRYFGGALLLLLFGCTDGRQPEAARSAQTAASAAVSDPVFAVPVGTKPVYRVLDGTPQQEGNARYLRARIVVPAGLDRATLEANIRHAAKTLYERDHPTGMFVFANKEGTDLNGVYTAGRCDFHPISKEKSDPTVTLEDCELKIDIEESYFQKAVPEPKSTGDAKLDKLFGIDKAAWRAVHSKLSEDQRKRIYYEIGEVNDRATAEANKRYPDKFEAGQEAAEAQVGKRNQLEEDLINRYEKALAKKHDLKYLELRAIRSEGVKANWPMPEPKP